MLTLDTLFAPEEVDSFLDEILGRAALYVPGEPSKFSGVVSWVVLNHLLEFGGLSFPRLRLFRGREEALERSYMRVGLSGYSRPIVRELVTELRNGAVLAIEAVSELHQPISILCQSLEGKLGIPVLADLYAYWQDRPVAPLRWNPQDVVILQVDGRRKWTVYCPQDGLPEPVGLSLPEEAPAWNGLLNPGDLLYVPRGWKYRDEPTGDHAMCLALRFSNPTGSDFLNSVTAWISRKVVMKTDLKRFGSSVRETEVRLAQQIHEELDEVLYSGVSLLPSYFSDMRAGADPRIAFGLPWAAHSIPLPPSRDFVVVPLFRFPDPKHLNHLEHEDRFEIIVDGRVFRFSEEVAPVLELILERDSMPVRAVFDECVLSIPSERIAEFLVELVKCAAICLKESP